MSIIYINQTLKTKQKKTKTKGIEYSDIELN